MTTINETVGTKKSSTTVVVAILVTTLVVVGVLVSRGRASSGGGEGATAAPPPVTASGNKSLSLSPAARAKNPVKVAPAELTKLAGDIQVVGTVTFHEDHYAVVGPLVTGRISKLIAGVG